MKYIIVLLVTSVAVGVAVQPGFDPKEVVRQVRGAGREAPGVERLASDDGEFLIDTSGTLVPAPGYQRYPAVAFDGANFLVVWEDSRNYSIFGARVTPQGTVLDPQGIVISQAAYRQESPALVFDGANFLVVWEDRRSDTSDIFGARVTPQGTVLDPQGIVISQAASGQWFPAVAFDGANLLVVWEDARSGSGFTDIYGARVTPGGTVLDPSGLVISQSANDQGSPALAFDGANFLVVWEDDRSYAEIYGARVTPGGTVLDPAGFVISQAADAQLFPAVAFDGSNFLVVWEDGRSGSSCDIYGARVTPAGTVLDPTGFVISWAGTIQWFPALGFDGTNFLVVWQDDRNGGYYSDIYGARVTPGGTVLDPSGFVISQPANSQWYPALGFDGTNFLVAWQDDRSGEYYFDIYGARVTPGGTVLDPSGFYISQAAGWEKSPALGFDGTNFLVVWTDERNYPDTADIYGARVTPGGTMLDPSGFLISQAAYGQCDPAIGYDGANFLVVWQDDRSGPDDPGIYGARVTPGGTVLDPSGFYISQAGYGQYLPVLAFDGANFLVVWEDQRSSEYDIYGARVNTAGTVLDPSGIAISTATNGQLSPAVAFDGTNFLVVWEDWRSGGYYNDIYGARVTPQGTVVDPLGFAISPAARSEYYPALAFDGANFLVVWAAERSYPDTSDIYGARVTPTAVVLDPTGIAISTAADYQGYPAVAFDDTDFQVVWEARRRGGYYNDIYGARVTSAGVVFDSGPVVRQEGNQCFPALACGAGSQLFVVYQGWTGTVGGKTYNTDRIWGKMNPAPGVEEGCQPTPYNSRLTATIVHGVLFLPRSSPDTRNSSLLDISGRKVAELVPGANDVSGLSPGVYFVRHEPSVGGGQPPAVTKVVTAR